MFKAVILGAPGAGKGTISSRIIKSFDISHISTGDLLRNEIKNNSKLGAKAKVFIEKGILVPDKLIMDMVSFKLAQLSSKNWLLDGFPRTREQAEQFHEMEKVNFVINLIVPFDIIMSRLKKRWIHVPSGRTYNEEFNAPKIAGKDDITGEPLEQRGDDNAEALQKRLHIYQEITGPVIKFYKENNLLHDFSGKTSDEIWPKVHQSLSAYLKPKN